MNETNTQARQKTNGNNTLPKLVEAGALFKRVSAKGTPYHFIKIMIPDQLGTPQAHLFRAFSNKYHNEGDSTPDWILYHADDNTTKQPSKSVVRAIKPAPSLPRESEADVDDANL